MKLIRYEDRTDRQRDAALVLLLIGLFGLSIAAFGLLYAWTAWTVYEANARADGYVLRFIQANGNNSRNSQSVVIEFEVNGERRQFQSPVSRLHWNVAIGDRVTVVYERDDPKYTRVESLIDDLRSSVSVAGFGALVVSMAILAYLFGFPGPGNVSKSPDAANERHSCA